MGAFSDNLARFRQQADLTQEEVATQLGITRVTYIKLEQGQKSPTLDQMDQLSKTLGVGIEYLIGSKTIDKTAKPQKPIKYTAKNKSPKASRGVNTKKLESVLLYILGKVGARPNIGQTVIYKILYFIDFDYYEKYDRSITGLRYYHNHFGPTPNMAFDNLTESLVSDNKLQLVKTSFHGKAQKRYLANVEPDLTHLSGQELKHIDGVLMRLSHKTASAISEYAHQDTPWVATKPGQPIDYRLAKYRTNLTSVMPPEDEL